MLINSLLSNYAATVVYSKNVNYEKLVWLEKIRKIAYTSFINQKVVLKANTNIPEEIVVLATSQLVKYVKTLMWGEVGSPIMIYKRK